MAFRAVKADTYNQVRSLANQLKNLATSSRDLMAAGNVSANVIRQLLDNFISGKTYLTASAAVSGMVEYAKTQEGDPNYDVAAEFTAMINACTGVINWITSNIPTGTANGFTGVLLEQWSASGVTVRSFTTAQTAGLRTALDTFIATVG